MTTSRKSPGDSLCDALGEGEETVEERAARVARIKWAVKAGAYDPDPQIIAALMLCGPRAIFSTRASTWRQ